MNTLMLLFLSHCTTYNNDEEIDDLARVPLNVENERVDDTGWWSNDNDYL